MKAIDLRDRSTEDLAELEKSLAAERFQNKFKNFTNRLDDTSVIRKQKRDLARVKLILTERARGITVVGKPREAGAAKPKTRAPKPLEASESASVEKTEKAPAKVKAEKVETKVGEKRPKAPAAAKPAAKKAKAKEETK